MDARIHRIHWASFGAHERGASGRLYALWPAPVQHDECFAAAGFTDFDDGGNAWDADDERLVTEVLAVLGEHGAARVRGEALIRPPSLAGRLLGRRTEVATPVQELLNASATDGSPRALEIGDPPRALVLRADGHEILWIWLADELAALWPTLLARAAGDLPVVETALAWEHLRPEELA